MELIKTILSLVQFARVISNIAFSFLLNHRRNTGPVSLEQQRVSI